MSGCIVTKAHGNIKYKINAVVASMCNRFFFLGIKSNEKRYNVKSNVIPHIIHCAPVFATAYCYRCKTDMK